MLYAFFFSLSLHAWSDRIVLWQVGEIVGRRSLVGYNVE